MTNELLFLLIFVFSLLYAESCWGRNSVAWSQRTGAVLRSATVVC